jgi:DNA-binding IclR family transcriptional regulator
VIVDNVSVRAVSRALKIVELLAEERRSLGVADIVSSIGLPQATVHRLLSTLVDQGWVERSQYTSRYRLGPGMLGTTAIALAHAPLLERGRAVLARLALLSGADAYLSVLVGRRVVFLERAAGAGKRIDEFHAGITQPAYCTAAGKALLAFVSNSVSRHIVHDPRPLRRYTPATITDPVELDRELTAVREAGYAYDQGEFNEAWRSIAVPVMGADGEVIAALSCGGPAQRMTPEKIATIRADVLLLAEELSRQVGLHEE